MSPRLFVSPPVRVASARPQRIDASLRAQSPLDRS
jgi:hypothetical protein